MLIVEQQSAVRHEIAKWKAAGEIIAFVPTMGNLHNGHLSLIDLAKTSGADRIVVSIFINPLQFDNREDFVHYPRTIPDDLNALREHGDVDLVFVPEANDLYPNGLQSLTEVRIPSLENDLCGKYRPGHFKGVCTIVTKLLNIVMPHKLVLGQKDYQQLLIVKQMLMDLNFDTEVLSGETIRDYDHLALSSRNRYLSRDERARANLLYRSLQHIRDRFSEAQTEDLLEQARQDLDTNGFRTEYIEVRDADTLEPPGQNTSLYVVLAAAYLGKARLIDNLVFPKA